LGGEAELKEGLMKTGDWGELVPFMMMVVSGLGWIRLGFLGTEVSVAGLYRAYWADMATHELGTLVYEDTLASPPLLLIFIFFSHWQHLLTLVEKVTSPSML